MQKGVDYVGVSTIFFCHDGKGKFLVQKRSKKARDEQEKWEVGGGSLEFGLTIEENLHKEIQEELCTKPVSFEFMGYRDVHRQLENGAKTHWVALDFKVLVDPATVKIGEPDMIEEIRWVKLSELPSPLHSQAAKFFAKYSQQLQEFN